MYLLALVPLWYGQGPFRRTNPCSRTRFFVKSSQTTKNASRWTPERTEGGQSEGHVVPVPYRGTHRTLPQATARASSPDDASSPCPAPCALLRRCVGTNHLAGTLKSSSEPGMEWGTRGAAGLSAGTLACALPSPGSWRLATPPQPHPAPRPPPCLSKCGSPCTLLCYFEVDVLHTCKVGCGEGRAVQMPGRPTKAPRFFEKPTHPT